MKIRTVALAGVAVFALSTPALAEDPGWYLGVAAGYDHPEKVMMHQTPLGPPNFFFANYLDGGIYLGSGGYKFASGLRVEVELGFDQHDLKKFSAVGGSFAGTGGASTSSGLLNLVYDYDLGPGWGVSLGGGLGAGQEDEYAYLGP